METVHATAGVERRCGAWIIQPGRVHLIVDHTEEKLRVFGSELIRAFGPGPKPACTLIPVPRLALDSMLVEIEAVAAVAV